MGPRAQGNKGNKVDVGERVEALLAQLRRQGGDPAADTGEELVCMLVDFYGAGLERVAEIVGKASPDTLMALTDDPLVESQLILHGVHPVDVDTRIERALDSVRPYLGSHAGGVAYLGIDGEGVAHLSLEGSCNGCPSSTVTVKLTIEDAVLAAAPELAAIEVEGKADTAGGLLQIGLRPGAMPAAPVASAISAAVWLHPSALELPGPGAVAPVHLEGRQVLMARLGETYFAYADSCPACGGSLAEGAGPLEGDLLGCGSCSVRYDVRIAGRAADGSGRRLEPLPLLDDVSGIRIALMPAVA